MNGRRRQDGRLAAESKPPVTYSSVNERKGPATADSLPSPSTLSSSTSIADLPGCASSSTRPIRTRPTSCPSLSTLSITHLAPRRSVSRQATRSARPPTSSTSSRLLTPSSVLCSPPSILVSNRDEFLHRPTLPATWRRSLASGGEPAGEGSAGGDGDEGSVLCGLDAVGGGTWLGLAKDGRLGVL